MGLSGSGPCTTAVAQPGPPRSASVRIRSCTGLTRYSIGTCGYYCRFDFAAAVLYPMAVLLYCYYNFSFDRDVYIVNAEILPDGNFGRFARMLADPAEVALFLINFNSLRMSGALDFALGVGMNLSFCYRFFRVLAAIQQRCHDPNQIIPTPKKVRGRAQRQRSVPRWMALIFLAASVFTFVYTYKSVTSSHAKCSSYPECVAYAHVWDSGGPCPCIIMVDGDRAPLSAHEWNFPEDVTEKVRALASAGMLNGLQLVNRELLYWPEELRQCTEMKTMYAKKKNTHAWCFTFNQIYMS
ncbi:unnamed protein product [Phytophthora lilii]|uniref:Unnamed protein product n=1 Tax=Phytophthora lilii TaxID=2077276 RepID=A0A9W6U623_9STRA|nr:unnamed protein product [Phytophthora lilii]